MATEFGVRIKESGYVFVLLWETREEAEEYLLDIQGVFEEDELEVAEVEVEYVVSQLCRVNGGEMVSSIVDVVATADEADDLCESMMDYVDKDNFVLGTYSSVEKGWGKDNHERMDAQDAGS